MEVHSVKEIVERVNDISRRQQELKERIEDMVDATEVLPSPDPKFLDEVRDAEMAVRLLNVEAQELTRAIQDFNNRRARSAR